MLESIPTAPAVMNIFAKRNFSSSFLEYYLRFTTNSSNSFNFEVSPSGVLPVFSVGSAGGIVTGTWYNVIAWHDAVNNQLGISVNNVATTVAHSGGVRAGNAEVRIGSGETGGNEEWDGLIDEVGVWKRVLTAAERTQLYNGGAGITYPFHNVRAAHDHYKRLRAA
jgi:hypothetical protein